MAKICIDAGHGGTDPGACALGRRESDDVLKMALKVGGILTANGHTVYYTRTTDIFESVSQKAREANSFGADFFASFHRNSASASALGYETLVYENAGKAKVCADAANSGMAGLGFRNRGTKVRTDLVVLNSTEMEAVLFEMGFISNSGDNNLFDSKFDEIAQVLASAIAKAVGSTITSSGGSIHTETSSSSAALSGSGYYGNSLVDYLKSIGQDSSYSNRANLAAQYGIGNYSGTAAQNLELLNKLRSGEAASGSIISGSGSSYTGNSLVDYLKSIGKDSSFAARTQYAAQYGIGNYSGTAAQNTQLLNLMRGGSKPAASSGASYYPAFSSNSIVDGLKSIGVDSSFSHRSKIAAANGISGYSGTASQNSTLCSLGRQGKLKKA